MKRTTYRKQYRRDAARPHSYAAGFVIPRHGARPLPVSPEEAPFASHAHARSATETAGARKRRTRRIEARPAANGYRAGPLRYAEAVAKVASIVLTAGNGVLLTVLFG